jgi:hypothetical protein
MCCNPRSPLPRARPGGWWKFWSSFCGAALFAGLLLQSFSTSGLRAENEAPEPPFPALTEEEIARASSWEMLSLPSPGEFFSAMAKGGRLNWSNAGRAVLPVSASERPKIALNLGVLLADGYLAIQNQNGQMVKNVGRDLLEMAHKLNVGEQVVARGRSINDFAENNDWNALREELESTQNEIKLSLAEQKDDKLVLLVAVGAWLRSLQAGSALVSGNYDPDLALLLGQKGLAREFAVAFTRLPERLRQREIVVAVEEGLVTLAVQMRLLAAHPDPELVEQIGATSSALIARITGPPQGEEEGPPPEAPPGTSDAVELVSEASDTPPLVAPEGLVLSNGEGAAQNEATPQTIERVFELTGALANEGFRSRDAVVTALVRQEEPVTLPVWLFARNEYWFAAASLPDEVLSLRLFAADGTPLLGSSWREEGRAVLGVVPLRTGWHFIQVGSRNPQPVPFSLVYSYK